MQPPDRLRERLAARLAQCLPKLWLLQRKPPGDIVDQREPRLLPPRRVFLVFLVGSLLFTVFARTRRLIVGSLDRP